MHERFGVDDWYTSIGFIGASRTGKSHATKLLLKETHFRNSVLVAYEDQKEEYSGYSKDIHVVDRKDWNAQAVDNFIDVKAYRRKWCIVLDDVDIFVHNANESKYLQNFPIAGKGHFLQSSIWQTRRAAGLPKELIQQSDYLIFTWGVDPYDYEYLQKYAGLNLDLYKTLAEPVHDPKTPRKLLSANYLILNKNKREQWIA